MPPSRLDAFYRRLLITRFFEKGWGKPENLQRLFEFRKFVSNRESCYKLVPRNYPVEIIKEEKSSDCTILEGKFMTPLELHLPGLVPKAAQQAHFQVLLPNKWSDSKHKPMCIHLAGTGDHYYWRRRNFIAKPLLKEAGLGAILLENPFYGVRKPEDQIRSNLHNVSDIFVMGGCLILECLVLLHWCERNGLGPLGITGLSMGGHMASLAATNWPKPLVLVPCLSWSTASTVFTQGVMSQSINWDMLETQYFSDGQFRERLAKMVGVIDNTFMAGQQFVKNFNQSMKALKHDLKEIKNISDIYQKNHTLPVVQQEKRSLIKIDQRNSLNLSESLHQKLTSGKQMQLFDNEIDELNEKIRTVQEKLRIKQREINFLNNPTSISTETLLNPQEKSVVVNEICDSSSSSLLSLSSSSESLPLSPEVGESAVTRLINYVYPKQQKSTVKKSSSTDKLNEMYYQQKQLESIDTTKVKWWEREALQFMRGMMDECTHLKNFSVPYDTSLIIAVCAKDDAYVPREGCSSLEDIWPGADVKYLDAGHVSAYVLHQKLFRSSIIEAFERAKKKTEMNEGKLDSELPDPTITYSELYDRYQRYHSQYSQSRQNQIN